MPDHADSSSAGTGSLAAGRARLLAVTGATGFVGRHVVPLACAAGWRARILTIGEPLPPELARLDIQVVPTGIDGVGDLLAEADACLNLAGEIRNTGLMELANVRLAERVVDSCLVHGVGRLVHLSSAGVVSRPRGGTVDEDSPPGPTNLYERTKWRGEQAVVRPVPGGRLRRVVLRPTIVFGPGKAPAGDSLYQLIDAIVGGRYAHVGSGRGIYNLCFVDDLADVLLRCLSADLPDGATYFINDPICFARFAEIVGEEAGLSRGCGRVVRPAALVVALAGELFARLTGRSFPLTLARYRALTNRVVFSDQRLRRDLNWRPPVGTEEGLRRTARWLLARRAGRSEGTGA